MSFIWQVCFGMQLIDFILKLSWCTTSWSSLNLLLQKLTTSLSFSRCVMSLWNRFKDHGGRDKTNMLLVDSGPANVRAFSWMGARGPPIFQTCVTSFSCKLGSGAIASKNDVVLHQPLPGSSFSAGEVQVFAELDSYMLALLKPLGFLSSCQRTRSLQWSRNAKDDTPQLVRRISSISHTPKSELFCCDEGFHAFVPWCVTWGTNVWNSHVMFILTSCNVFV